MTQEDKELLLKDLCARLPYHPQIRIYNDSWEGCRIGEFNNTLGFHHVEAFLCDRIEITPYLRPMSSMTEEEKKEIRRYFRNCIDELHKTSDVEKQFFLGFCQDAVSLDYLNSHYFDYRGLIGRGLALEAPEGMYNEKEK